MHHNKVSGIAMQHHLCVKKYFCASHQQSFYGNSAS